MPDVKISALPASTTPLAGTEVLPIVQSATTRQVSVANLTAGRAVNALSLTASSLTSGRVTYAGTAGLLQDSASLTFDGTNLTTTGTATATQFIPSGSTVATNGMFLPAANTLGFSTNSTRQMTISSLGYVGIGVSSPTQSLQIGNAVSVEIDCLIAGTRTSTLYTDNVQFVIEAATNINMLFNTNATERMRITGGGNVGIGTTTATGKLSILQSASATPALTTDVLNAVGSIWHRYTTASGVNQYMDITLRSGTEVEFTTNSKDISLINSSKFLVQTTGIITMGAYGAGAATFSASGVISSVSDETWKTKDGVPTNTDAMLQKLEPGYWFYNEEKAPIYGQDRQLGFYAQNVHEAIGAEAAPTPEEGKPWGYYDRSVLAVTVMSLKNALNTIEELKQRITALENK